MGAGVGRPRLRCNFAEVDVGDLGLALALAAGMRIARALSVVMMFAVAGAGCSGGGEIGGVGSGGDNGGNGAGGAGGAGGANGGGGTGGAGGGSGQNGGN